MSEPTAAPIPPDVAAYLQDAAINLAAEQGFHPESMGALAVWMEENRQEIGSRALAAMDRLRDLLFGDDRVMGLACTHISQRVYASIQ